MASKNVSVRLNEHERGVLQDIATREGTTQAEAMRSAIKHYNVCDEGYAVTARNMISETMSNSTDYDGHPLMKRINEKGIVVHNEDGSVLRKITDMNELLNFVNSKVFRDEI